MGVKDERFRHQLWTATGMLFAIGVVVLLNVLAGRLSLRFDVTTTGRLALADRTKQVLLNIEPGTEVVLAADTSGRTRSASEVRRVLDVLDEMDRASTSLTVSVINTSAASGQASFEGLVRRLAGTDQDGIAASEIRLTRSLESLQTLAADMEALAQSLESLRGRYDPSRSDDLGTSASRLRATAAQIEPMVTHIETLLGREIAGERLPDLPESRRVIVESADAVRTLLRVTSNRMTALGNEAGLDEETRNRVLGLATRFEVAADAAGAASVALQAEVLPPVVRVIGALTTSEALLVFGPRGVAAVSMDDLFPASAPGAAANDPGRRAESLVTNALSTLDGGIRPMVVVTHAGTSRVLAGGADSPLASLRRRSGLRGVEWVEWPVAMEPEEPGAIATARAEGRPVVFVVIGIDTSAQGGAERAARSAAVLRSLIEQDERLMINLAPSTLPGLGETDPMAEAVALIGLQADTGRPVLVETRRGSDRLVGWEQLLVGSRPESDVHPLTESIAGLAISLPWATVLEPLEGELADPVLSMPTGDSRWREGEWLGYWVTPQQQRGLLVDKPSPGGTRDASIDRGGVVWALDTPESRRLVVGSHLWLFDQIADRPAVIDGRVVQQNPGNAELFLAAIEWLAGNDSLLGQSAAALATPTVQPIEEHRLSLLGWLIAGGLPLGLLLIGIGFRIVRG